MKPLHLGMTAAALALIATSAFPFGTIHGAGQDAEHERITRHAFSCDGAASKDACFEEDTLDTLAGKDKSFGAIGIPDSSTMILDAKTHCDGGDHLDVPGYPQSKADANAKLADCRAWMATKLDEAVKDAGALVDAKGEIDGDQIPTMISCVFAGGQKGRAKCNVLESFGILLHASQDFYSHTNWTDRPNSAKPVGPENPPGLGNTGPAPWLDLRKPASPVPDGLISGCFGIPEKSSCTYDGDKLRVMHEALNKDKGKIDPQIGKGTTERGKVNDNFKRAVEAAIADSRDKWATLREKLIATYGKARGDKMICALTRDDPEDDC
jgi:hypothetical protein